MVKKEYAKFTLVVKQHMKFYSGGENLDTKSQVLRLRRPSEYILAVFTLEDGQIV